MKIQRPCANPYGESLKGTALECRKVAVTYRTETRGVFGKPERMPLCETCAELIDEGRREAAWEARVS